LASKRVMRHLPWLKFEGEIIERNNTVKVYAAKPWPRPMVTWEPHEAGWMRYGVKGTIIERDIHRLREAHKITRKAYPDEFFTKYQFDDFNDMVIGQADRLRVSVNVIDALECLNSAARTMRDFILFDSFRPTNLGVRSEEELVLVDPMFDYELLDKTNRAQRRTLRCVESQAP
jgi:hypothetical protein